MKPTDSQALKYKSPSYPERYDGRVPLVVRMTCNVRSDIPVTLLPQSQRQVAMANVEYECHVNSNGAVSVIFPDGQTVLGVKPDEFVVTGWHPSPLEKVEELLRRFDDVRWDRWGGDYKKDMVIFGWIDRDDGLRDFILLLLDDGEAAGFSTSSAKFSKAYHALCGFPPESHRDCKRVELTFKNCKSIKL